MTAPSSVAVARRDVQVVTAEATTLEAHGQTKSGLCSKSVTDQTDCLWVAELTTES